MPFVARVASQLAAYETGRQAVSTKQYLQQPKQEEMMIAIRKAVSFAAWSLMFVSSPLLAGDVYVCKQGALERHISITYAKEGSAVPCQVNYTKEDGASQGLWDAQNEEGYCERKADEFAEKLRGFNWDCAKQGG